MGEMTAADYRARAAAADQAAADSFERCDTDGFLSQWASGLSAQRDRMAASIVENGGRAEFQALFDLDGNLIAAKLVEGRYGMSWGLLESDDPHSRFVGYFNPSGAASEARRRANDAKKGFYVGAVMASAEARIVGKGRGLSGTAWAARVRTDGGFSRDVEVVDNGHGEEG